ncbi:MAG: pilus assembly protein [Rhodobacteraceae bacterium]|nr:pilus assembly protein [Paracoccaceae bacterium]
MTLRARISRAVGRFGRDEDGATLVEFAIVLSLFLLIFFGLIDFGRMAFHYVVAERGMYVAARVAAVRPPACPGVPESNQRGPTPNNETPPRFGTSCNAGATVCTNPGTISCDGTAGNSTADEVWTIVQGTLPNDATIANLRFSYTYDGNLGFLGGPYVPVVTVELQNLNFQFVSPLAALVGLAGGAASPGLGDDIAFPSMSVSLPAEDLAMGTNG